MNEGGYGVVLVDCGVVEVNSEEISAYEEMNEKGGTSCVAVGGQDFLPAGE